MHFAIRRRRRQRAAQLAVAALFAATAFGLVRPVPAAANVCSPWPGCFGTAYQVTGTSDNSLAEWTYSPAAGGTVVRSVPNGTTLIVGCQANDGPQEDNKYNVYPSVPSRTWDFVWDGGISRFVWVYDWWMNTPPQQSSYNWYSWPDAAHHCNFTAPSAPTAVNAQPIGTSAVSITWVDHSSGTASFVVSNGGSSSPTLPPGTTSYLWTGLIANEDMCFTITATLAGLSSSPSNQVCATTRRYVNLGDSYASGEGAGNGTYVPGTNTPGVNMCHRSDESYAHQYTSGSSRWQSVTNVACSGAETGDMLAAPGSMNDQNVPTQGEPAQISALDDNTGLVTIMLGGNNLDVATLLSNCYFRVNPNDIDACFSASINSTLYAQISALESTLEFIYQRIQFSAPNANLVVLTYPQIFPETFSAALAEGCGTSPVQIITSQNQLNLIRGVVDRLDAVIRQAAANVGARVIDLESAFAGHELCTPDSDVNPISLTGPTTSAPESFHPNIAGYAREAALIKDTLDALS